MILLAQLDTYNLTTPPKHCKNTTLCYIRRPKKVKQIGHRKYFQKKFSARECRKLLNKADFPQNCPLKNFVITSRILLFAEGQRAGWTGEPE
jgi:hypothetical protein